MVFVLNSEYSVSIKIFYEKKGHCCKTNNNFLASARNPKILMAVVNIDFKYFPR